MASVPPCMRPWPVAWTSPTPPVALTCIVGVVGERHHGSKRSKRGKGEYLQGLGGCIRGRKNRPRGRRVLASRSSMSGVSSREAGGSAHRISACPASRPSRAATACKERAGRRGNHTWLAALAAAHACCFQLPASSGRSAARARIALPHCSCLRRSPQPASCSAHLAHSGRELRVAHDLITELPRPLPPPPLHLPLPRVPA